ncbi:MAG: hypothetical protein U0556_17345 [Dehalococcoidia bacterium]
MDDRAIDQALDRTAAWLLRELGAALLPSQRALVREALQQGYLYGEHSETDMNLAVVGAAYADAAERLNQVSVMIRLIDDGAYGLIAALDLPLSAELEAEVRQAGGGVTEDGAVFVLPTREAAAALVSLCQNWYLRQHAS